MRYLGQSFELTVTLTEEAVADDSGASLRELFHATYEQVYGYVDEAADLELLDVRATAVGVTRKPRLERVSARRDAELAGLAISEREIFIDDRLWRARVLDRPSLPSGAVFEGPAIVEQYDTTVFVPTGFTVTVDRFGNLIGEASDAD